MPAGAVLEMVRFNVELPEPITYGGTKAATVFEGRPQTKRLTGAFEPNRSVTVMVKVALVKTPGGTDRDAGAAARLKVGETEAGPKSLVASMRARTGAAENSSAPLSGAPSRGWSSISKVTNG